MTSPSEVLPWEPLMSFPGGHLSRVSQFTDLGEPGPSSPLPRVPCTSRLVDFALYLFTVINHSGESSDELLGLGGPGDP